MKIEEKQLVLGEKIAKIAIFAGIFLWMFQVVFSGTSGTSFGVFILIAGIFGMVTILAYVLKMFLNKGEAILKLMVIFGGIGFLFLVALAYLILGIAYMTTITMMILAFLILAGLVYEAFKKNLDKYEKFIPGLVVFIFGFSIGFFSGWTGVFSIIGVILLALGVALYLTVFYFKGTASTKTAE
ncbi:MAG: hypothetical protein JW776_04555 [Candidatus Lokiarchaeota archaeon]|nr:hypothetical protein [Candidatus Lokiarchaeota archaeon]